MEAGWFFATANWNEHEEIKVLPVHPDDLSAGLVIPQYEPVAVRDGYIRPLYTDKEYIGIVLSLTYNPTGRKLAGFLVDSPYDDDGNLKTERKLCIIRDGKVVLPAIVSPPEQDWMVEGKNWYFLLQRQTIQDEKHIVAYLFVTTDPNIWYSFYTIRSGMCRVTKLRRYYVGGTWWWLHQVACGFHPSLVFTWEGY
jgi:hypothetical protein